VGARWLAFNEVTRNRKRRASETYEWHLKMLGQYFDCLQNVGGIDWWFETPQTLKVGFLSEGLIDGWPYTRNNVNLKSHSADGNNYVRKQYGRVNAVSAHWLQCDLSS